MPHVHDVTDDQFEQAVLVRSREVPVVVDFWAPWCGPCRMIGPVLEALAAEYDGGFELAKINTDDNPVAASTFGVRGIPHVIAFRDGRLADQFVGALPEADVRAFLKRVIPSAADELTAEGERLAEAGEPEEAQRAFEQAVAAEPAHARARLGLAQLALIRGDLDQVDEHVGHIPVLADERELGDHLVHAAAMVREAQDIGDPDAVQAKHAADPADCEAGYAAGAYHMASGRWREALDAFLAVVTEDRKWRDEAGRKAMLTVFGLLGVHHALSDEYRRKLMLVY
ncbi:thioredoxin [Haliangium sp.]|uniref:thioredoxin n=1 Tax=Haliangium sp. TaxID=2663208 RepID=UPI003D14A41A